MQKIAQAHNGWLITASLDKPDTNIPKSIMEFIAERAPKLVQDVTVLMEEPGIGHFYIECSDEIIDLLRSMPSIEGIAPHSRHLIPYEVRVSPEIKLLGTYVKNLKILLSEHLMQDDVCGWAQRPGRFYIRATERAALFISTLTGVEKVIQRS